MRLWVRFQLFPCYSHFCTTAKHWALTLSQAFCAMLSNMCACARNVIIPSPTPPHPPHFGHRRTTTIAGIYIYIYIDILQPKIPYILYSTIIESYCIYSLSFLTINLLHPSIHFESIPTQIHQAICNRRCLPFFPVQGFKVECLSCSWSIWNTRRSYCSCPWRPLDLWQGILHVHALAFFSFRIMCSPIFTKFHLPCCFVSRCIPPYANASRITSGPHQRCRQGAQLATTLCGKVDA